MFNWYRWEIFHAANRLGLMLNFRLLKPCSHQCIHASTREDVFTLWHLTMCCILSARFHCHNATHGHVLYIMSKALLVTMPFDFWLASAQLYVGISVIPYTGNLVIGMIDLLLLVSTKKWWMCFVVFERDGIQCETSFSVCMLTALPNWVNSIVVVTASIPTTVYTAPCELCLSWVNWLWECSVKPVLGGQGGSIYRLFSWIYSRTD